MARIGQTDVEVGVCGVVQAGLVAGEITAVVIQGTGGPIEGDRDVVPGAEAREAKERPK